MTSDIIGDDVCVGLCAVDFVGATVGFVFGALLNGIVGTVKDGISEALLVARTGACAVGKATAFE
jgi:hypothetical protein